MKQNFRLLAASAIERMVDCVGGVINLGVFRIPLLYLYKAALVAGEKK